MAIVRVEQTSGFNSKNFWVQNTDASTDEGFETQTSTDSSLLPPSRTDHYQEFVLQSGGLKYNYVGDWAVSGETNIVTNTVSSSGTYNTIVIESGASGVASVTGLNFDVDFGSTTGVFVLDLVTGLQTSVIDLIVDPASQTASFANLHRGATPNIAALAFAGDDWMYGNVGNDVLSGFSGNDRLIGRNGDDVLIGGGGNDKLLGGGGNDKLVGGAGNDVLIGGAGSDRLFGGGGKDIFQFGNISETPVSGSDYIFDFESGTDLIDLKRIDATASNPENDSFTFIGSSGFTGVEGQLRVAQIQTNTIILGDVNGDGVADFRIIIKDLVSLTAADFIL